MAEPWSAGRWSVGLEYTVVTVWSGSLSAGRGGTSDGSITSSITCGQNFFALEASMAESQRTMFFRDFNGPVPDRIFSPASHKDLD